VYTFEMPWYIEYDSNFVSVNSKLSGFDDIYIYIVSYYVLYQI